MPRILTPNCYEFNAIFRWLFSSKPHTWFLPCKDPLKSLPSSYKALQLLLDDLPREKENGEKGVLGINGEIEKRVADLPNFIKKVEQESDPFILQALFRAYAFLSSAYTLAPAHFAQLETGKYGKANQQLPAQLAFLSVQLQKNSRSILGWTITMPTPLEIM